MSEEEKDGLASCDIVHAAGVDGPRYSISSNSSAAAGSQTQIQGRCQVRVREARATIQANKTSKP